MYVSIFDILGIVAALLTLGIGIFLLVIKFINRKRKKKKQIKAE